MEFISALFICPVIVIAASIIGYLLFKNWVVMPLLTFIVFTIFTFTTFNESFFIWVVVYTIISIAVTFMMKFSNKTGEHFRKNA